MSLLGTAAILYCARLYKGLERARLPVLLRIAEQVPVVIRCPTTDDARRLRTAALVADPQGQQLTVHCLNLRSAERLRGLRDLGLRPVVHGNTARPRPQANVAVASPPAAPWCSTAGGLTGRRTWRACWRPGRWSHRPQSQPVRAPTAATVRIAQATRGLRWLLPRGSAVSARGRRGPPVISRRARKRPGRSVPGRRGRGRQRRAGYRGASGRPPRHPHRPSAQRQVDCDGHCLGGHAPSRSTGAPWVAGPSLLRRELRLPVLLSHPRHEGCATEARSNGVTRWLRVW
jgi:hypothetical protein